MAEQQNLRAELEAAIVTLGKLLEAKQPEEKFQSYFTENPIIFECMGYKCAIPKPRLRLGEGEDGEYLEPDFIAETSNGIHEILDLKLPEEQLIKYIKNRNGFYAKVNEYLAQVLEYSEYFDDSIHRRAVVDRYGIDVQKGPAVTIIIGRDRQIDTRDLVKLSRRLRVDVRIVTYDEVLASLYACYSNRFGHLENLAGASIHAGLLLRPKRNVESRQYFFDCGPGDSNNRFSIFVNEKFRLCFEIFDSESGSHMIEASAEDSAACFEDFVYLCCEFGSTDQESLIQMMINNRIVAKKLIEPQIPLPRSFDFSYHIVGADRSHVFSIPFSLIQLRLHKDTLKFEDRWLIREEVFGRYQDV